MRPSACDWPTSCAATSATRSACCDGRRHSRWSPCCRWGSGSLLLACLGLYGVMAYRVVRRTREIGIRIAVGARQQSAVWMMVREMLVLVSIGAALGTVASLAVNRLIAGRLFGVTPRDPAAIVIALLVLGCVTLIAGYVPARHASRIDPVRALRAE